MPTPSFLWYDYETFGTDPRVDRISQFAAIRTDMDFNIIDEPIDILCRASDDILPNPDACLITGITPQKTFAQGLLETDFIEKINQEFSQANTCVLGFNNLRFDDEFTRYTLYRNFLDPYMREWQNGCSRWDIIDLVRITRALRPEGINWPVDEEGTPTNRLELITEANNISHEAAHDALSDVYATIAVAKLIKQKQPRLFDYVYQHKQKQQASQLLNVFKPEPVLHTSGMFASNICNTALVYPLAQHPTNKNGIIVFNLMQSPEDLIALSAEEIIERLYTPTDKLPPGVARIPLKTVHINKCPVLAPLNTLNDAAAIRTEINLETTQLHQQKLDQSNLTEKLHQVFSHNAFEAETDPDKNLYGGGFFSPEDRQRMQQLRELEVNQLVNADFNFDDSRLPEMLFRYRARNFPETLSTDEQQRWKQYRQQRFLSEEADFSLQHYETILDEKKATTSLNAEQLQIIDDLEEWGKRVKESLQ